MPEKLTAAVSDAVAGQHRLIPVYLLGTSLSLFFALSFVLCVLFDLIFPGQRMYEAWLKLLPGFAWLTWSSFALGLAESLLWGWYIALVFGPIFNFFAARASAR